MASHPTRLRQIAFVAEDLDRQEHLLTKIFGTEVIYRDPAVAQWGLRNILVPLGGDIIEVVSPIAKDTTASRLLSKRAVPACGYMIIMQTSDARAQRKRIEAANPKSVVFAHDTDSSICVQYHPKLVPGGVIPELDSMGRHAADGLRALRDPMGEWHACGENYAAYVEGFKRHSDLRIVSCSIRLPKGNGDVEGAAERWGRVFGVRAEESKVLFTNAVMIFLPGMEGHAEGLESITVEVASRGRLEHAVKAAKQEGLYGDGRIQLCGIRWYLVLKGSSRDASRL